MGNTRAEILSFQLGTSLPYLSRQICGTVLPNVVRFSEKRVLAIEVENTFDEILYIVLSQLHISTETGS
jgi:hypothetical protein